MILAGSAEGFWEPIDKKIVDTSDDWIVERSGIRERHRAAPGEYTSDLAVAAASGDDLLAHGRAFVACTFGRG